MQKFKMLFYYWLAAVVTAVAVFGGVYTNARAGEITGSEAYFTHSHSDSCYVTETISCNGQHEEAKSEKTIKAECDNCREETGQYRLEIIYTCPVQGGKVGEYVSLTCNRCGAMLEECGSMAQQEHTYTETKVTCGLSEGEKTAVLRITADNTWTGNGVNLSASVSSIKQDKTNNSITYSWNGGYLYVTDNGTYTVTATNAAGQSVSSGIQIGCIDKTAPVIGSVTGNTATMTRDSITVSVAASDSGSGLPDAAYSIDGGGTWSASSAFTVTEGVAVSFVVRDRVGNVSRTTVKRSDFAYPPEPTATPTPTPTPKATVAPTETPKATAAPTATPKVTVAPTEIPTVAPTVQPTVAPTETPKATAAPTVKPIATPEATAAPTVKPTATPKATAAPTVKPTATPKATAAPTVKPTATPKATAAPTVKPTATPEATAAPTVKPTATPEATTAPTVKPTATPEATAAPTVKPIATPEATTAPTVKPIATPEATTIPTAPPKVTEKPAAVPAVRPDSVVAPIITPNPTVEPDETSTLNAQATATPSANVNLKTTPTASAKDEIALREESLLEEENAVGEKGKSEKEKLAAGHDFGMKSALEGEDTFGEKDTTVAGSALSGESTSDKNGSDEEAEYVLEENASQEADMSEEKEQSSLVFPVTDDEGGNGGSLGSEGAEDSSNQGSSNTILISEEFRQSESTEAGQLLSSGLIAGVLLLFGAVFCVLRMFWLYSVQLYCYDGGDEYRRLGMLHLKKGKNEFALFLPEYMTESVKTPRYRLLIKNSLVKKCKKMELVVQNEEHKLRQPLEECIDFML